MFLAQVKPSVKHFVSVMTTYKILNIQKNKTQSFIPLNVSQKQLSADEGGGRRFDGADSSLSLVPYTSSHSSGLYRNCGLLWPCWEGRMEVNVFACAGVVQVLNGNESIGGATTIGLRWSTVRSGLGCVWASWEPPLFFLVCRFSQPSQCRCCSSSPAPLDALAAAPQPATSPPPCC